MDRIEEMRAEMLKAGYSAQDADRVCQLEAECGRECDAIRAKYDAQISGITGKYVSAEEQYEAKLAGIEERITAMRQELKENSTYTEEDIEEICDIESSYERHCALWEKAYLEAGLAPEGPGFELRILDEEVWREKELKEIDEKYWFSEFREEGEAPALDDSKYDYAQQRMIQEGYYPMELI
ncbi:MAG: hypothetical protein NC489_33565, partial [Ruminococcus flavefaciens]|nr:hypothetical protein [Ruminococcus flavefaciens]